jgi:hypothetical protein
MSTEWGGVSADAEDSVPSPAISERTAANRLLAARLHMIRATVSEDATNEASLDERNTLAAWVCAMSARPPTHIIPKPLLGACYTTHGNQAVRILTLRLGCQGDITMDLALSI